MTWVDSAKTTLEPRPPQDHVPSSLTLIDLDTDRWTLIFRAR